MQIVWRETPWNTRVQLLLLFIDAGLGATLGGKLALRAGGRRQTVPDALTGALDRVLHWTSRYVRWTGKLFAVGNVVGKWFSIKSAFAAKDWLLFPHRERTTKGSNLCEGLTNVSALSLIFKLKLFYNKWFISATPWAGNLKKDIWLKKAIMPKFFLPQHMDEQSLRSRWQKPIMEGAPLRKTKDTTSYEPFYICE